MDAVRDLGHLTDSPPTPPPPFCAKKTLTESPEGQTPVAGGTDIPVRQSSACVMELVNPPPQAHGAGRPGLPVLDVGVGPVWAGPQRPLKRRKDRGWG